MKFQSRNKAISILLIVCLVISLFASISPRQEVHAASIAEVNIDCNQIDDNFIRLEQYNNLNPRGAVNSQIQDFMNQKVKMVRYFGLIPLWYKDSTDASTFDLDYYDRYFNRLDQAQLYAESILMPIKGSPECLSGENWNRDEFKAILKAGIKYHKEKYSKLEYISAWNEPNHHDGTMPNGDRTVQTYIELYGIYDEVVKEINAEVTNGAKLKIGGPITASYHGTDWIKPFIEACKVNNYALDFVGWNHYSTNAGAVQGHVEQVKGWLTDNGFDNEKVEVIITEYGIIGGGSNFNPSSQDLLRQAAMMSSAGYHYMEGGALPMHWINEHSSNYIKSQYGYDFKVSSGTTTELETYEFDNTMQGRYIRIEGYGNYTKDDRENYTSVNEIQVFDENSSLIEIKDLYAGGEFDNIPNLIDGDLTTYWENKSTWRRQITLDLGEVKDISGIKISWNNGDSRQYKFSAQLSDDDVVYHNAWDTHKTYPYGHLLNMQSMLAETRVQSTSTMAQDKGKGVRTIATKGQDEVVVLVWNYQDRGTTTHNVDININNLPSELASQELLKYEYYLVDEQHSNYAYDGNDMLFKKEYLTKVSNQSVNIKFPLSRNGIALVRLTKSSGNVDSKKINFGQKIVDVMNKEAGSYTSASWKSLMDVLDYAIVIYEKADASDEEIQNALNQINTAESDLISINIEIYPQNMDITVGEISTVYANIIPSDLNQNVIWSSSNTTVAKVYDGGIIAAIGTGTAVIRATSVLGNECYAESTVTVSQSETQELNIAKGKTVTATSERVGTYPKENAVDGIIAKSSRWMTESSASAPQKLEIDLGQSYEVGSARVFTGVDGTNTTSNYAIKNFKLRYLNDSLEWEDISGATVEQNANQNLYFKFSSPVNTNKIQFYSSDNGTLRVLEIELYEYVDVGVDKTALNMAIMDGLDHNSNDYTVSTWGVFQKELSNSILISQDQSASALEVNNALEDLKASMENLIGIFVGKDNIALHKTVLTNSPGVEGKPASAAVDGSTEDSNRWITNSKAEAPQWLIIELDHINVIGSAKVLSGSKSGNPEYTISDYKLQYYDGVGNIDIHDSWLDIAGAEVLNNREGDNVLVFNQPVKADKIRFISEQTGTLRVREIELYKASNYLELTGTDRISKGSVFDIGLDLKNVNESIHAYDITLSYDSQLFEFVNVEQASSDVKVLEEECDMNGTVRIIAIQEGGTTKGNNNLLTLKFKAKEATQNMNGSISVHKAEAGIGEIGGTIILPTDQKVVQVLNLDSPIADNAILQEKIIEAQSMEQYKSLYTAESWANLELVLIEAIKVNNNIEAKQEDVDAAVSALEIALLNLIRVTDEFDTLRLRYYEYLTGGTDFDPTDEKYAEIIAEIDTNADNYWNSMNANFVWDDLEANSTKVPGDSLTSSANKAAANQFRYMLYRLKDMALAYSTYGSKYYQNDQIKDDIIKGVDWVYDNRYNENTSYFGNWYSWQIANPETLSHILILLYDELSPKQIQNYSNAIDYHLNHGHFDGLSASGLTGANLVNMAQNRIWNGIVAKRADWIQEASDAVDGVLSYVTLGNYDSNDADGFYSDGSFIQHAAYPYAGGYGAGFIAEISNVFWMLSGSTWEVNYADKDNIYDFIFKTYEPNVYKAIFMNPVVGRYASRREGITTASPLIKALLLQSGFANNPYEEREKSLVKYYLQQIDNNEFKTSIWLMNKIDDILNDSSIIPRQNYTGYYQFYYQDTAAHHRPDWTMALRMHSSRIANYESINLENRRGWYTGDGMTYLYLDDDDYGEFYLTTADQHRMPGTTVDINRDRPQSARTSREQSSKDFVGGTSFNNLYGVSAMDFKQHYADMDLQAKKSWFMFDNEVVALGSGINSTSNRTIETIIENRKLDSHNTNIFTVDGNKMSVEDGWQETMNDVTWAHLEGTGGYYFPNGVSINAVREKRSNDNFVINEYLRYKGTDLFNETTLDLMTWAFVREDSDNWRLDNGHLIMTAQQGSLEGKGEGTNKNLLLKEAPTGDYYMTTKLDFSPEELGQEAGIMVYLDDDNYISLAKSKDLIIWKHEVEGILVDNGSTEATDNTVFLTVEKQGEEYSLYVSSNADNWETETAMAQYHLSGKAKIGVFAQGGQSTVASEASFNEFLLNHTNYHLAMWKDHGIDPVDDTYSYVLLPAMEKDEVSSYVGNPDIEILANTKDLHAVKETKLNLLGATFWNPGSVDYIEAQDACTVMAKEKDDELTIAVSDPSQKKQTVILNIDKSVKGIITKDPEVKVLELSPSIKIQVDVSREPGKTFKVKFALGEIPEISQPITQSAADKFNHVVLNYDGLTDGHKYYLSSDVNLDESLINYNIFGSNRPVDYTIELTNGHNVARNNGEYINIVEVDEHDKVLAYKMIEVTEALVLERDTEVYNTFADTFVRGGTNSDTNYGTEEELMIKSSASESTKRNAYFMFDYNGFSDQSMASAVFKFYVNRTSDDATRTIKVYGTSTDWTEETINWANAPAPIEEEYITSLEIDNIGNKWYEVDITNYVNSKMDDKKISFVLVNEGEPTAKNHFYIESKESTSGNVPKLIIAKSDIRDPLGKAIDDLESLIKLFNTLEMNDNMKLVLNELESAVNKAKEVVIKVTVTENDIEAEMADLEIARSQFFETISILDILNIHLSSEASMNQNEYAVRIKTDVISESIFDAILQEGSTELFIKEIAMEYDADLAKFIQLHPVEENPYYLNEVDEMTGKVKILPVNEENNIIVPIKTPFINVIFKQLSEASLESIENFIEKIEVELVDDKGNMRKITEYPRVSKKALIEKINEAEHKREVKYTKHTWVAMKKALDEAYKIKDNPEATQEDVNSVLERLKAALRNLRKRVISDQDDDDTESDSRDKVEKQKDGSAKIVPKVSKNGKKGARSVIDQEIIAKALTIAKTIKGRKNIVLEISEIKGAKQYTLDLPTDVLTSNEMDKKLEIKTPVGTVVASSNMFNPEKLEENDRVEITIGIADKSNINDDIRKKVGDRPIIELHAKADGNIIAWNNPNAPVTVSIHYEPTQEELSDPEHIVVWYIDGQGQIVPVPNAKYDLESGNVTFTTTHFSEYAIAFNKKTFEDIEDVQWAKKAIEVMASKGVINGTSDTTYNPKDNISRAEFISLLVRTLELNADFSSNFDDVNVTDYFYEALGVARALGITNGVGDNQFNPHDQISRQDMMVLMERALKITGKTTETGTTSEISKFDDVKVVSDYAVEGVAVLIKEGIIQGSNNKINPLGTATRAETAVMMYRILKKYM